MNEKKQWENWRKKSGIQVGRAYEKKINIWKKNERRRRRRWKSGKKKGDQMKQCVWVSGEIGKVLKKKKT